MTRFLRIALAIVFLASSTLGAVAETHGFCDQSTAAQHQQQHKHNVPNEKFSAEADADIAEKDSPATSPKGEADALGALCHSGGVGCPGCVTPSEQALYSPVAAKLAFVYAAVYGQSEEPSGDLRPPKFS
jgi:hypothetical protein